MDARKGAEGFVDRVKQVMDLEQVTASELARRIGTAPSVISSWINKGATPGFDYVLALSRALGVNLDWLIAGEGPMRGSIRRDEFALVDYFGPTDPIGGVEFHPRRYAFRIDWLKKHGVEERHAICTRIPSDSMSPTILPGDLILLQTFAETKVCSDQITVNDQRASYDISSNKISIGVPLSSQQARLETDSIYLFRIKGRIFMRRIQPSLQGDLTLSADNRSYGNIIVTESDAERLIVVGKVVWIGRCLP